MPTRVEAVEILKGDCTDGEPLTGNVLELGTVAQGAVLEQPICFRNRSAKSIRITKFESSCECLSLRGLSFVVAPRQAAAGILTIDLANESSFVGECEVGVTIDGNDVEPILFKVRYRVKGRRGARGDFPLPLGGDLSGREIPFQWSTMSVHWRWHSKQEVRR